MHWMNRDADMWPVKGMGPHNGYKTGGTDTFWGGVYDIKESIPDKDIIIF